MTDNMCRKMFPLRTSACHILPDFLSFFQIRHPFGPRLFPACSFPNPSLPGGHSDLPFSPFSHPFRYLSVSDTEQT